MTSSWVNSFEGFHYRLVYPGLCLIIYFRDIMFGIKSVLTCVSDMNSCRLTPSLSLLVTSILHVVSAVDYSSLGVSNGWLREMGLTEVPTSIPCALNGNLDLQLNSITRIEANSFTCLDKIDTLDIGYNNLTYIARVLLTLWSFCKLCVCGETSTSQSSRLIMVQIHPIWDICISNGSNSKPYPRNHISTKCQCWNILRQALT